MILYCHLKDQLILQSHHGSNQPIDDGFRQCTTLLFVTWKDKDLGLLIASVLNTGGEEQCSEDVGKRCGHPLTSARILGGVSKLSFCWKLSLICFQKEHKSLVRRRMSADTRALFLRNTG